MPNTAEFTLLNIVLLDYYIPQDEGFVITNDEVMWNYSMRVNFSPFPAGKQSIHIFMGFKLYYKNDAEKKTIAELEIDNHFTVKADVNLMGKLKILNEFLNITNANIKGIYAAKAEGTSFAEVIPSPINFRQYDEGFKQEITKGWK